MPSDNHMYIWRCINCSNHFANIDNTDGSIRQEKRCSKCKALNAFKYEKKEIMISCKFYDPITKGYGKEISKTAV